jgi:hypothetical protein
MNDTLKHFQDRSNQQCGRQPTACSYISIYHRFKDNCDLLEGSLHSGTFTTLQTKTDMSHSNKAAH